MVTNNPRRNKQAWWRPVYWQPSSFGAGNTNILLSSSGLHCGWLYVASINQDVLILKNIHIQPHQSLKAPFPSQLAEIFIAHGTSAVDEFREQTLNNVRRTEARFQIAKT